MFRYWDGSSRPGSTAFSRFPNSILVIDVCPLQSRWRRCPYMSCDQIRSTYILFCFYAYLLIWFYISVHLHVLDKFDFWRQYYSFRTVENVCFEWFAWTSVFDFECSWPSSLYRSSCCVFSVLLRSLLPPIARIPRFISWTSILTITYLPIAFGLLGDWYWPPNLSFFVLNFPGWTIWVRASIKRFAVGRLFLMVCVICSIEPQ